MSSSRLAARVGGVLTAKEPLKRPPECMQGRRGIELAGVELGVVPSLVSRGEMRGSGRPRYIYIRDKYE